MGYGSEWWGLIPITIEDHKMTAPDNRQQDLLDLMKVRQSLPICSRPMLSTILEDHTHTHSLTAEQGRAELDHAMDQCWDHRAEIKELKTARGRVMALMMDHQWHSAIEICQPEIGGSEGLRRLREIKGTQMGGSVLTVEKRRISSERRTYEYRLTAVAARGGAQ